MHCFMSAVKKIKQKGLNSPIADGRTVPIEPGRKRTAGAWTRPRSVYPGWAVPGPTFPTKGECVGGGRWEVGEALNRERGAGGWKWMEIELVLGRTGVCGDPGLLLPHRKAITGR